MLGLVEECRGITNTLNSDASVSRATRYREELNDPRTARYAMPANRTEPRHR